ncbi:hypothetical protein T08_1598 [Trichinella sp. T8]|nr:hypothetical protein T08_1598 [Trichinella sp. T8]
MQIDKQAGKLGLTSDHHLPLPGGSFVLLHKVTTTVNLPNVKWCSKTRSLLKTGLSILIDKKNADEAG